MAYTTTRGIPLVFHCVRKGCMQKFGSLIIKMYHCSPTRFGASLYVDHDLAAAAAEESKTIPFPVRYVEFTTSGVLIGQKSPTGGLKFNAAYVDSNPEADASVPTVVTLHGTPGSHLDFKHMLEGLPSHNMRVISLNFPGFNWTRMGTERKFRHTTLQKTAFLMDFLESIKVPKVDVLVSHSAGAYPAVRLCANTTLVQSLLLVNPAGHRFMKSFKPWCYFKSHAEYSRIPVLRTLMLALLKLSLISTSVPNKDALLMSTAIETLARFDYKKQQEAIRALARKKFPVFIMYSENDNAVEASISNELATMLGGTPALMQHYNAQAELAEPVTIEGDHIFRGYVFEKAGHFLTKRHPHIVNQAILDLHNATKRRNVC